MPPPIVPLVPHIVGPRGSIRYQVRSRVAAISLQLWLNGVFTEQLLHQLPRLWRQVFFRDERDGLMALAAPGPGRTCNVKRRGKYVSKNEESLFHDPTCLKKLEEQKARGLSR